MEIRELTTFADLKTVEHLQRIVWGVADLDILAPMSLKAAIEAGNLLLGAFDGTQMVGFLYAFLGHLHGQFELHSDMTGIIPAYRDRSLGYQLKLRQREWALARQIQLVTWTFDPLRSRNAYFNFHKLSAVSKRYCVNFYGEDSTSFFHQNSTDRLWVEWELASERVHQRLTGSNSNVGASFSLRGASDPPLIEAPAILKVGPNDEPLTLSSDASQVSIEIPLDPDAIGPAQARRWRAATRAAFIEKLAAGYIVTDARNGCYLLER